MHGPKVSLADLNARVAERVANCADSSPIPLETEAFFIGQHVKKSPPSRPVPFMFDVETTAPYFRWAEDDRQFAAAQLASLPKRLKAMDRDLELLRVRQAVLRNH